MVESLSRGEKNCLSPSLAYGQVSISQQIFGLVLRNSLVAKKEKKKKKIHLAFIWEISAAALHFRHPRGPPKGNRQEWGLGEEEGVFLSPRFWQLWRAWGALLVAQNPHSWVRMPSGSCFPKNMITQKITQEIHILGLVSETCWCMHMKCRREPSSLSSLPFCQSGFSKHIL